MVLAAPLHHSAQRVEAEIGGRARDALRPTGTEDLAYGDAAGASAAVTVGHVAAGAPLLVVPPLAGGDGVDGTTVYLLAQNLKLQKREE